MTQITEGPNVSACDGPSLSAQSAPSPNSPHRSRYRYRGDIAGTNGPGIALTALTAAALAAELGIEAPRVAGTGRILGTRPVQGGLEVGE